MPADPNRTPNPIDEPDPSVIWRWMARATAPWVAWLLIAAGIVAIIIGWAGSADKTFPAQQIPYLISGGMLGIGLIFLGGIMMGVQDLRRAITRITSLEQQVHDLHAVLLAHPDAPDPAAATGNGAARPVTLVALLPTGSTFHRLDCGIIADKDAIERTSLAEAEERGLAPCKLCSPVVDEPGVPVG